MPFQLPSPPRDVERYAGLPESKTMAIHVNGRVRVGSGAAGQAAADGLALAACNQPNPAIPCVLYARGNRVVLSERLTEAPAPMNWTVALALLAAISLPSLPDAQAQDRASDPIRTCRSVLERQNPHFAAPSRWTRVSLARSR